MSSEAARRLLAERVDGHWVGELSSSALSTATAIFALKLYVRSPRPCTQGRGAGGEGLFASGIQGDCKLSDGHSCPLTPTLSPEYGGEGEERIRHLIANGTRWLIAHQNPDGGWGDTIRSYSNISTTALCWAALTDSGEADALHRADAWLAQAAGSLEPRDLATAIAKRYGKDKTFCVPILTMCALAGRLGSGRDAWRFIPALPFELAACPHQWFTWIKLPVVSYALPALIAMGHVRHHHRPTRNPITRTLRALTRRVTLKKLREIQPAGGGYLEATPLTSFVVMSLLGADEADSPTVGEGIAFLIRSARPDGSWPIDTNLATWLTTLSVNALAIGGKLEQHLAASERGRLVDWLLHQQFRVEHLYTHAPPGGWAWTDLPGGVPDADDTAGALIALYHLAKDDPRVRDAAIAGVTWLLNLQNRDGGMPTFCRGWGALPFDCSGADLTAHALHAWAVWRTEPLPAALLARIGRSGAEALRYLKKTQNADGSWLPLWFGSQDRADEHNPVYGTSRVLTGLAAYDRTVHELIGPGVAWLVSAQRGDGAWGGGNDSPAGSTEETALAVVALAALNVHPEAQERGREWLRNSSSKHPSPIGFYFAKLWYFEKLYPLIYSTAALMD